MVITERTLGDNQDYQTWRDAKYDWKSEDDASGQTSEPVWPEDEGTELVAVNPQRIRLFRVQYAVAPTFPTFLQY